MKISSRWSDVEFYFFFFFGRDVAVEGMRTTEILLSQQTRMTGLR